MSEQVITAVSPAKLLTIIGNQQPKIDLIKHKKITDKAEFRSRIYRPK